MIQKKQVQFTLLTALLLSVAAAASPFNALALAASSFLIMQATGSESTKTFSIGSFTLRGGTRLIGNFENSREFNSQVQQLG